MSQSERSDTWLQMCLDMRRAARLLYSHAAAMRISQVTMPVKTENCKIARRLEIYSEVFGRMINE